MIPKESELRGASDHLKPRVLGLQRGWRASCARQAFYLCIQCGRVSAETPSYRSASLVVCPKTYPRAKIGTLYNWAAMKLLFKFNLVLILVFGTGIGVAGYISHSFLEQSAREEVLQQARLMMGAAGGMRTYTSQQLSPLLQAHQARIKTFLPQTVPAFSATEVFNYLRGSYPDYTYKEATLNPTNLRDRAVDWEADVIENFRSHAETKESSGQRSVPGGDRYSWRVRLSPSRPV